MKSYSWKVRLDYVLVFYSLRFNTKLTFGHFDRFSTLKWSIDQKSAKFLNYCDLLKQILIVLRIRRTKLIQTCWEFKSPDYERICRRPKLPDKKKPGPESFIFWRLYQIFWHSTSVILTNLNSGSEWRNFTIDFITESYCK